MSPELDTLDQLLGSDLPLMVVRQLYPDGHAFVRGVLGLLSGGDVNLLTADRSVAPAWRWKKLLTANKTTRGVADMRLSITDQGARRIR